MSDLPGDILPADEPMVLAGEYVLGTLDAGEQQAAETRIAREPAFAASVKDWERKLYPLASLVAPVDPPATLWPRIERTTQATGIATKPPANDNTAGVWRVTALASMAIAAGLAAFIVLRPPPRPIMAEAVVSRPVVAVLSPTTGATAVLVAVTDAAGGFQIRPTAAIAVPPDRDLQLWSLPPNATVPASLGVLPSGGKQVPGTLAVGGQLLVSVEPKGGSPTGQPTGPVIYGGKLTIYQ